MFSDVYFFYSLFMVLVLGGMYKESMDGDKQNVGVTNYQRTSQE
ncbi:MAG: hypothetical protein ACJAU2_001264 [Maribacter sp.]|jgi:hypothetical protein